MKKHELLQNSIDTVIDCCENSRGYDNVFALDEDDIPCFQGGKIYIPLKASKDGKRAFLTLVPDIEFCYEITDEN